MKIRIRIALLLCVFFFLGCKLHQSKQFASRRQVYDWNSVQRTVVARCMLDYIMTNVICGIEVKGVKVDWKLAGDIGKMYGNGCRRLIEDEVESLPNGFYRSKVSGEAVAVVVGAGVHYSNDRWRGTVAIAGGGSDYRILFFVEESEGLLRLEKFVILPALSI